MFNNRLLLLALVLSVGINAMGDVHSGVADIESQIEENNREIERRLLQREYFQLVLALEYAQFDENGALLGIGGSDPEIAIERLQRIIELHSNGEMRFSLEKPRRAEGLGVFYVALGHAYMNRRKGDQTRNAKRAKEAFEVGLPKLVQPGFSELRSEVRGYLDTINEVLGVESKQNTQMRNTEIVETGRCDDVTPHTSFPHDNLSLNSALERLFGVSLDEITKLDGSGFGAECWTFLHQDERSVTILPNRAMRESTIGSFSALIGHSLEIEQWKNTSAPYAEMKSLISRSGLYARYFVYADTINRIPYEMGKAAVTSDDTIMLFHFAIRRSVDRQSSVENLMTTFLFGLTHREDAWQKSVATLVNEMCCEDSDKATKSRVQALLATNAEQTVPFLLEAYGRGSHSRDVAIFWTLTSVGAKAVPALLEALRAAEVATKRERGFIAILRRSGSAALPAIDDIERLYENSINLWSDEERMIYQIDFEYAVFDISGRKDGPVFRQ